MGIRLRDSGGTLRTITRVRARDSGGTLRTIQQIRARDASGTLRTVFQYFFAAASAYNMAAAASGAAATGSVTSAAITITPTGGTAPYTYAWSRTSGSTLVQITSPTAAATTFANAALPDGTHDATFQCLVTDNIGNVFIVSGIDVQLIWTDTR